MAARAAGTDRNEEITSLLINVYGQIISGANRTVAHPTEILDGHTAHPAVPAADDDRVCHTHGTAL